MNKVKIGSDGHKLSLKQKIVRYLLKDAYIDELHVGAHSIVIDGDVIQMNPLASDPVSPSEGWMWHLAGESHKPRYYDGTNKKDIGEGAAPGTHSLGGDQHLADTLANLSAKVSDDDVVGLAAPQTLTNKALTAPAIGDFTNAGHNHQAAAGGGKLDHGSALDGLNDDDHSQYLNNTRHDTTSRHPQSVIAGAPTGDYVGTTDMQELSAKTLNNAKVKDVDPTPVGDVLLKVLDGVLRVRNSDDTANANIVVAQAAVGDILFANGYCLTEDEEFGMVLVSPRGKKFRMTEC